MFPIFLLLLALLPSCVLGRGRWAYYESIPRPERKSHQRVCSTPDPGEHLRESLANLKTIEPLQDNDLWSADTFAREILNTPLHKRQLIPFLFSIPTYFHVVSTQDASSPSHPLYASDTQLQNQFTYLKSAFAPLHIDVTLQNITRTTNDNWASGRDELTMKQTLRRGPYSALNIYIHSDLKAYQDNVSTNSSVLGVCTLPMPNITTTSTRDDYTYDGCQIISAALPGGAFTDYNLGGTAVHEIGHWLGLLHTFEGRSCEVTSWGDYVADTPQQRDPTTGCPVRGAQDTCPNSGLPEGSWNGQGSNPYTQQGYSGPDNTRNWMDYSTDRCYESFSAGQGARIINGWSLWRKGK